MSNMELNPARKSIELGSWLPAEQEEAVGRGDDPTWVGEVARQTSELARTGDPYAFWDGQMFLADSSRPPTLEDLDATGQIH